MNQGLLESLMLEAFHNTPVSVHERNFDNSTDDDLATAVSRDIFKLTDDQMKTRPVTLFRRYFSDERNLHLDSLTGQYILFCEAGNAVHAKKDISALLASGNYSEIFSIQLGSNERKDDIDFAFVNFTYNQEPGAFYVDTASDADLDDTICVVRHDDLTNAQLFLRTFQKYSGLPFDENKQQIIADIRTLIKKVK